MPDIFNWAGTVLPRGSNRRITNRISQKMKGNPAACCGV
jgi:hypothetical protein